MVLAVSWATSVLSACSLDGEGKRQAVSGALRWVRCLSRACALVWSVKDLLQSGVVEIVAAQ